MTYVAKKTLRIQSKDGLVVEIQPGHPVDVSEWSDFVIRSNIAQHRIEKVYAEAPKTVAPAAPKKTPAIRTPDTGRSKTTKTKSKAASKEGLKATAAL